MRELDVVLFGATGFTGRLVAAQLAAAAPAGTRIGLAGRSAERLEAVRRASGPAAADWPLLRADLDDPSSLAELARATRVLATAAGPYSARGLALVEASVRAGTHYADLAGEVLFMRDSAERHHDSAVAKGVRIVHACGVDSIPSDLGVFLLAERAGELSEATLIVRTFRGGFSGGTVATARRQLAEIRADPARRAIVEDPYALSPDREHEPDLGDEGDLRGIARDRERGLWLAPFVMAGVNTRVVRRSNALLGWTYGRGFRYREAVAFPGGAAGLLRAAAAAGGLRLFTASLGSRAVARLLPAPGEGPDERRRLAGRLELELHARAADGRRYVAFIAADGDPGYGTSSVLLAESALCLALDEERLPPRGGVLTPAAAMGVALAERLRPHLVLDVGEAHAEMRPA